MSITAAEIMARCDQLAVVSDTPGLIRRVYLSPEHARVNAMAAGWMREAGMTSWTDAAGNQWGRYEGAEPDAPALVLGSHLDTVTDAGRYDGILGVMLGIGVVARLHERGQRLPFAVEVVAFGDEEGTRFGTALLGSRAVAGTWDDHWWDIEDANGIRLDEAFVTFGLEPGRVEDAARTPADLVGYLEAHIEQGPELLEAHRPVGVVSSIAGARRFAITVEGTAGHAGTPWERRRDALAAASEMILAVERIARHDDAVATVGRISVHPGGVNIIPGRAEFSLDLRGRDDATRDRIRGELLGAFVEIAGRRDVTFAIDGRHTAPAAIASTRLQAAIAAGVVATGDAEPMVLWSRAGHDAMAIAAITEFGMLFTRCGNGGISHHPDESVTVEDVAVALTAFEAAVLAVAAG